MIVFRYLSKEIATAVSAVTGILLLIFLSNQFVHYLSRAATGKFGGGMVVHLMIIEVPHLLGLLLPLGLFLGILLSFGRLYTDNEMTVLSACGLSRAKLVMFTLPVVLTVVVIVAVLNLWLTPQLMDYRDHLLAQTGTAMELEATLPGRFQEANGGQQIFYVESMSPDKQSMQTIFMAQLPTNNNNPVILPWTILTAESGYQTLDKKTGDRFFVAVNGRRYLGIPGNKNFQIADFNQYRARIESRVADVGAQQDAMTMLALWQSYQQKVESASELQWRFSMPMSVLLLALLAVPLSYVKPRQGRYAALLPAILTYIIYANLLLLARNWMEAGNISPVLGIWWVHGLALLAVILAWWRRIGWRIGWDALTKRRWRAT